jgi:peptidoglycan hydrolase-like protein with peptidoglycan-binding domain
LRNAAGRNVVGINASVGLRGINDREDVETIQALLNRAGANLLVDGNCGRDTIAAICSLQRQFLSQPDGLIDPNGTTLGRLEAGTERIKNAWVLLPPDAFHYNYAGAGEDAQDRQWGTPKTIAAVQEICRTFHGSHSIVLGIGDISLVQGGPMNGHTSGHRIGKNIDMRPVRRDQLRLPVTVSDGQYDRDKTLALAKIIEAVTNVRKVLFGDRFVQQNTGGKVQLEPTKHHNHLHVEMIE